MNETFPNTIKPSNRRELTHIEWTRQKDSEKRLKRKLIQNAKEELRSELLKFTEREDIENQAKLKMMEQWVFAKKAKEIRALGNK